MIIESPRLKEHDLPYWRLQEKFDDLSLKIGPKQRRWREQEAVRTIQKFAPDYIGVSWGKDSVVTAHLAYESGVRAPLVWVRVEPLFNPECLAVRDAFLDRFDMPYIEHVIHWPDELKEMWRDHFARGNSKSLGRSAGFSYVALGTAPYGERYVSGIRAQESAVRALRARRYGTTTKYTCAPISSWKDTDVFAYLRAHDLPVNATYAMTLGGFLPRDVLRVDAFGGNKGTGLGIGRDRWEAAYFPDVISKIYNSIHQA